MISQLVVCGLLGFMAVSAMAETLHGLTSAGG